MITKVFEDFEGRSIRLTPERLRHILEHPEMRGMKSFIKNTLLFPERVIQSLSDLETRLYYRYYFSTVVGDKYLCVVVKENRSGVFILTAYLTDTIKKGKILWPKRL